MSCVCVCSRAIESIRLTLTGIRALIERPPSMTYNTACLAAMCVRALKTQATFKTLTVTAV